MHDQEIIDVLYRLYITKDDHSGSDYFAVIEELVEHRNKSVDAHERSLWQKSIDIVYESVAEEIVTNSYLPLNPIKFGTSGWRGILGKDIFVKSVCQVTQAIISLYNDLDPASELAKALGVSSTAEAQSRGCVVGHDNRFGGEILARAVTDVLTGNGFTVYYAGESTTGVLSAAVLELEAAFSINLTPSHNPLQYGGFKFNAADAGPALPVITNRITEKSRIIMAADRLDVVQPDPGKVKKINALDYWVELVGKGHEKHGLNLERTMAELSRKSDFLLVVDCVHGASRVHMKTLFKDLPPGQAVFLRTDNDPTFGGIAPEPSSANLAAATEALRQGLEPYKIGAIIDPDADRIRFTDGANEISMNQFGAMAYHYLHEVKHKKGMVAKSVATSNFANALAASFGERVFESKVGFKEFKPVVDKALVRFEESDGISIIGHTPEKDSYIGLLLALDMVLTLKKNLGEYLQELQDTYGAFFPGHDSISVSKKGEELQLTLSSLKAYEAGNTIMVGAGKRKIAKIIDIDGYKMIFEDGSWIMIRASGTEPKVRFYYEARTLSDREFILTAAKKILIKLGLA